MTKAHRPEPSSVARVLPMPNNSKDMGVVSPSLCSIYTHTSFAMDLSSSGLFYNFHVDESVGDDIGNLLKLAFQDFSCPTRRGHGDLNNLCRGAGCTDLALVNS